MFIRKFFILFCTFILSVTSLQSVYFPSSYTVGIMKANRMRKDDPDTKIDRLLKEITNKGFTILKYVDVVMTTPAFTAKYDTQNAPEFVKSLIRKFKNRRVLILFLQADRAVIAWRAAIKRFYLSDDIFKTIHGSASTEDAAREIEFFFPEDFAQFFR